jgi:hypothetical protein
MKKTLALIPLLAAWHGAFAVTISDPGQGVVALSSGATAAAELSGLTYAGGTSYYAVGDNGATSIWTADIAVNAATGQISSASVTGSISAGLGNDSEGIAFRSGTSSVFVSNEVGSTIKEFSISSGANLSSVTVPAIYSNLQGNFGLESLSLGGGNLWTANEEALTNDGALSSTSAGSWVRLQRFDGTMGASGQWAYRTDPISAVNSSRTVECSGVSDLLALPTGELLVLERELAYDAASPFRSRLYEVDFTGASSDVDGVADLSSGVFTAVSKTLLWQGNFLTENFEGITLGPTLADGSQSILLISDNGSGANGQTQSLYALTGVVPESDTVILFLIGCAVVVWAMKKRRGRGLTDKG